MRAKAADQRGAVPWLEFVEARSVHDPRDEFTDVDRRAVVFGHDGQQLLRVVVGIFGLGASRRGKGAWAQILDDVPHLAQGLLLVLGKVVGHTGRRGVHVGATKVLCGHLFACGGLDQGGAGEENRAVALDDDRFIGHGRHIGATGRAGAENGRHLRDAVCGHFRLIPENAAEVIDVREHLVLHRQEGST